MEKNRKTFKISDVDIESDIADAFIGFYAFSGNHDYISSFFREGKINCFKVVTSSLTILNVFKTLGDNWEIVAKDLYDIFTQITLYKK